MEFSRVLFRSPLGDRVDSKIVVAVDSQRRDAEAQTACSEGAGAAAGDALKGRDGPLIVDQVQDHRRLIGRSADKGCLKIRLHGRAVADPGGQLGRAASRDSMWKHV